MKLNNVMTLLTLYPLNEALRAMRKGLGPFLDIIICGFIIMELRWQPTS